MDQGRRLALTRREILCAAFAAGIAGRSRPAATQVPPPATRVNFEVPPGACDCHVHVHGDPARFPMFSGRVYTPPQALPEELLALHKALGIQRVVIVTPSIYGTDNSATLYGMKFRGDDARGVAVIDEKTTETELDAMHRAGIRGIRLNLATAGISDPAIGRQRFQAAVARMRSRGWHIQINTTPPMIAAIRDLVADAPVPVVFDHFGGAQAALGVAQPAFADLIALVKSGKAYVKISAAYRSSTRSPAYADAAPLARALISANMERVLWGTDWPHPNPAPPPGGKPTDVTPFLQIDDAAILNLLAVWAPDPAVRRQILVTNPARLYGF
jgi:predicted TIM-barrel fold metal-dependent hydrolase